MRSFINDFVSRLAVCICASLYATAHAGFVLETPVAIGSDNSTRLAVSNGGQKVLVAWDNPNGVYYQVSDNGGESFRPGKQVDVPPPVHIDGLWLEFDAGSVPLLSANGSVSRVLASLGLETDPFFPPPGLPPMLHMSFPRLYDSGAATFRFRYTHKVAAVSDRCDIRPGLGCSALREFDAAMSDDAARVGVLFNTYGFDGQQGDTWFVSANPVDGSYDEPLNLSQLVTPGSAGNDFDPRIEMTADGSGLFALWREVAPGGDFRMNFTASQDGGASWTPVKWFDAWHENDLAYAEASSELFLAYSTGYYFLTPPAAIQVVQSNDGGGSFSTPVTVALKHVLGDGTEMMPTNPVRVSASSDGEVIAVLFAEEPCDPVFGCLGGSSLPFDIVLSVSEDGGDSFERIGVIAQSHFAQSVPNVYDVHVREDGGTIYIVSHSEGDGATVFLRAVRQ